MAEIVIGTIMALATLAMNICLFFLGLFLEFLQYLGKKMGKAKWPLLAAITFASALPYFAAKIRTLTPNIPKITNGLLGINIVGMLGVITGMLAIIAVGALLFFLKFTTVQEGTAKVITRLGAIQNAFIALEGHKLDSEGEIIEGEERHFGGLRFVGIRFVDKVHRSRLRWHSVELKDEQAIPVLNDKELDYVMLRPDVYWMETLQLETKDGQFPDVKWGITMSVINPRKVIFRAPHNWVENVLTLLRGLIRQFGRTKTLEELLSIGKEEIWKEIGADYLIETRLKKEWGVKIHENGIDPLTVTMSPEDQEALASRTRKSMETAGRAEEIMGTVLEAVAIAAGKSKEEIQKDFYGDPQSFYEKHEIILINTMTKLAIEEGVYFRTETPGATGVEAAIINFLTLLTKGNPTEKTKRERSSSKDGKKTKKANIFGKEYEVEVD